MMLAESNLKWCLGNRSSYMRRNIFWNVSFIPMALKRHNKWKLFNTKIRPALIVSAHCDKVSLHWENPETKLGLDLLKRFKTFK